MASKDLAPPPAAVSLVKVGCYAKFDGRRKKVIQQQTNSLRKRTASFQVFFKVENLLKERSLKVTFNRLAVLSSLINESNALAYSILQQRLLDLDRITLYRTIKALIDKGIVHKAMSDEKDSYYALCNTTCGHSGHRHDHVHFSCMQCKTLSYKKRFNWLRQAMQWMKKKLMRLGFVRGVSGKIFIGCVE